MLDLATYCTSIAITPSKRLDLFTPTALRIRTSSLEGEPFPAKYQIPFAIGHLENWPSVDYQLEEQEGGKVITTEGLQVRFDAEGGWTVWSADGQMPIAPSEGPIHGLFRDGYTHFDHASAFGEVNENSRYAHYFYDPQKDNYHETVLEEDALLDEFFIYGPDYPSLFAQFRKLVGAAPVPPRKAFGCFQTQHLECRGTQETLMADARCMRERKIPCDYWIIDYEWGDGCRGSEGISWGDSIEWSSSYTSPLSPAEMLAELKRQRFDTMLIHHSVPDFEKRLNQGWTGKPMEAADWWAGMEEKLGQGIAGTWQDTRRNDITNDVIQRGLRARMDGRRSLMVTNYDTQEIICWNRQNYKIPQANAIGTHRYAIHWTGDCDFTWAELRWQVEAITGGHGAMKGVAYLNSDTIGRNWKILLRWRQFNALCPIARSHNTKPWVDGSPTNEQWLDGFEDGFAWEKKEEITPEQKAASDASHVESPEDWSGDPEEAIRRIQSLRYQLVPYLYHLALVNWQCGLPLVRPLLMAFPEDTDCAENRYPLQYMLGSNLLVAPVCRDVQRMDVYLPAGTNWYDWFEGCWYQGGQTLDYDVSDLNRLPLFVREGAVLPLQPACEWLESTPPSELILHVFGEEVRGELLEDAGEGYGYEQGELVSSRLSIQAGELRYESDGKTELLPTKRRITLHWHRRGEESLQREFESEGKGVTLKLS